MTALGFASSFSNNDLNTLNNDSLNSLLKKNQNNSRTSGVYKSTLSKKTSNSSRTTNQIQQRCNDSSRFSFRNIENTYEFHANKPISILTTNTEIERSNCWDHLFNPVELKQESLGCQWEEYKMPQEPASLKRKRDEFETSDFSIEPSSDDMSICEIVSTSKSTPPRPCKKSKSKPNKFALQALKVLETKEHEYLALYVDGKEIKFRVTPLLDADGKQIHGDFVELCTIAPHQPNLFAGYENSELLLKRYRKDKIILHPRDLDQFMINSLQQHNDLFNKKFPINPILNATTAINDAFFIVPKVNHPFPIKWNSDTDFKSLEEISKWLLTQVKAMIQYAFDNKITIGMKSANVRINDNNEVILIDPMERTDLTFLDIINNVIKSYSNHNQDVADYLYPDNFVEWTLKNHPEFFF